MSECDSIPHIKDERRYNLNQIYFYLAEGCNLKCRHCWISPKYQAGGRSYPTLPFPLFKSIIDQGMDLGLKTVKLTGGEPLLHPQILEILEYIKAKELRLTIETNGTLCTKEVAKAIAACKNPFVSISIDGPDEATHEWVRGVPGCFDAALNGFKNLVDEGIKPQVIMSIMRRNHKQLKAVVSLAESVGAGSVKFNIVTPIARGEKLHEQGETLTIEELVDLDKWVNTEIAPSAKIPVFSSQPLAFKSLGKMLGDKGCGCGVCGIMGIIGVLPDGSYALCGIGENIPELKFGNAVSDRLEEVWRHSPVILSLREGLPGRLGGICKDCAMKAICKGNCIAMNYYRSHSLWEPYWYCEEAHAKGLFPATRVFPKINI